MKYYYGKYIVLILFLIIGLVGAFWNKNLEASRKPVPTLETEILGRLHSNYNIIKFKDRDVTCYLFSYTFSMSCVK